MSNTTTQPGDLSNVVAPLTDAAMAVRYTAPDFAIYLCDVAVAEARAEVARLEYHEACSAANEAREMVEFHERETFNGTDARAKYAFSVYQQNQADANKEPACFIERARLWLTAAEAVRNQVAAIFECEAPELFDSFETAE